MRGITSRSAYQRQALIRIGILKAITDALNAASDDVAEQIIAYVVGSIDGPDTYWDAPGVRGHNTPVVAGYFDELPPCSGENF